MNDALKFQFQLEYEPNGKPYVTRETSRVYKTEISQVTILRKVD